MTRPYTDLFIDFDDTLYDTQGNSTRSLHELFAAFRLDQHFVRAEDFIARFWQINEELWAQYAHGEIERDVLMVERFRRPLSEGLDFVPTTEFCLTMSDYFLQLNREKGGVVEGAHELMAYLRERGYRTHLCSNGFGEVQFHKLKASQLDTYFDHVVLSEEAKANKPSLAFFNYAFERTGAQRATTLMIGDNFSTDIVGAMNAGVDTLFFNRQPERFAAPTPPTFTVTSLAEIMTIL